MPVVGLSDGDGAPVQNSSFKAKEKRKVSYSGSRDSRAIKRASIEDKEVEAFKIRLDDMIGEVHSIKDDVSRRSCASSAQMDPVEVAIKKLNELKEELDVLEDHFFRAADYITDLNKATMIITMNDASRKNWLLKHI
jgi:hypothetical protein